MKVTNTTARTIVLTCGTALAAGSDADVAAFDAKHPAQAALVEDGSLKVDGGDASATAPAKPKKAAAKDAE